MRLLLAEDEKDLADALTVILKHNNYSVDAVYNGLDAYDYMRAENYDGVILDIMMPGMNGIEVLKKIRAEGNGVPVLILTARAEIDDRVEGLDAGADDYLTKPFAAKELLARIRAITRRRTEAVSSVLEFGGLTLDQATFTLSTAKGKFRLPNKEFQMLELLMANPGQVISSDHFLEKIWGLDSETELNVVWVYISYLRKKLASLGAEVQIRAARGQGYFLERKDKGRLQHDKSNPF